MLEIWIEFGRGPLFRSSLALLTLGLLRVFLMTALSVGEGLYRSSDHVVPWGDLFRNTLAWMFPVRRLWVKRPLYSSISFLFHIGLLAVPLFLAAHILLWNRATGFRWPALPQPVADWMTLLTVAAAIALFAGRVLHRASRSLSRFQDYVWPLLLSVPFASGYICSNLTLSPDAYRTFLMVHIYAADLILASIPFTKAAHCVLFPISQIVSSVAWKFPVGAGDRVAAALGFEDRPTWVEKARLGVEEEREKVLS